LRSLKPQSRKKEPGFVFRCDLCISSERCERAGKWFLSLPSASAPETKEENMDRYRCLICDYVYDPEAGDPENGVAPGTAFENLPADWVCPLCGADQSNFEKI
jgi:rubredoxin